MSGGDIALDTNQVIAVLNDTGDAGRWVQTFARVYVPVPVVGELRFGALNSRRAAQNLLRIEKLVSGCQALAVTVSTAEVYARVRVQLKQKGKPIPENDIWIAALCIERSLPWRLLMATSVR